MSGVWRVLGGEDTGRLTVQKKFTVFFEIKVTAWHRRNRQSAASKQEKNNDSMWQPCERVPSLRLSCIFAFVSF